MDMFTATILTAALQVPMAGGPATWSFAASTPHVGQVDLEMKAVIEKPKRVATGLGLVGAVAQALTPGISEFVLNQAFRLFPDSLAAQGVDSDGAEAQGHAGNPVELARKLFSQVFSGIHW